MHISKVIEYNKLVNTTFSRMAKYCQKQVLLWNEVNTTKDISNVYELAKTISYLVKKIKEGHETIFTKMNFRNINFLILYIEFFDKVVLDSEEADKSKEILATKINRSDYSRVKSLSDSVFSFQDIDNVGICIISGDINELGRITFINMKLSSIFKYEKEELVGHSINKIVPYYIGQFHDDYIMRYFKTATKHILDKIRIVFGLNSEGFIFPVYINVRVVPDLDDSIRFIGLLKKIEKNSSFFKSAAAKDVSRINFIMTDEKYNIVGVSKDSLMNFGFTPNIINDAQTNLNSQVNFSEFFSQLNFFEDNFISQVSNENGISTIINTRHLEDSFFGYLEILKAKKTKLKLKSEIDLINFDELFTTKNIILSMTQLSFNDHQHKANIFKIKMNLAQSASNSYKSIKTKNSMAQFLDEKKIDLNKSTDTEVEDLLIKNEIRKISYKAKNATCPKSVLFFLLSSVAVLITITVFGIVILVFSN